MAKTLRDLLDRDLPPQHKNTSKKEAIRLTKEIEDVAWAIAEIPTCDMHGLQLKAAVYAQFREVELAKPPANAIEAILASLIRDLLRGTPWPRLALTKIVISQRRPSRARARSQPSTTRAGRGVP